MLELEHDSTASELAMIRQACAHFQTSLQLEPDNEEAATNLYQCSHKLPAAERPVQAMSASRRHQLQQQVTEYKFAAATRICNAGPVDSSMDVVGANGQTLPILSFLGSLLTPSDEPHWKTWSSAWCALMWTHSDTSPAHQLSAALHYRCMQRTARTCA